METLKEFDAASSRHLLKKKQCALRTAKIKFVNLVPAGVQLVRNSHLVEF